MVTTGLGPLRPPAGHRSIGWVSVPGGWRLPGFVVSGAQPGPTLSVIAGLHGSEVASIQALRKLARELNPDSVNGTVRGVICVNMPALAVRAEHVNPADGLNLNRIFPGDRRGTASFRVVNFVVRRLIEGADAFVDLHGGDRSEKLLPYVVHPISGNTVVDTAAEALACAYGLPLVGRAAVSELPGRSWITGALLGVPSVLAEAGGQGRVSSAAVAMHLDGLHAVMAWLGMSKKLVRSVSKARRAGRVEFASAAHDGIFETAVGPGTSVGCGAKLGVVTDVLGAHLQELRAPIRGTVVMIVDGFSVRRGEHLVGIANEG